MAIYGPSMVNSDRGSVEYGGLVTLVAERIEKALGGIERLPTAEQVVSADLRAMEVLVRAFPKEAATALTRSQIERWRDILVPWMNSKERTLPKDHRVSLIDETNQCLDFLEASALF